MKLLLRILPALLLCGPAKAQIKDTTEALELSARCKYFEEDKADSLLFYSKQIDAFSQKNNFRQGISDAIRLKGIFFELTGRYDSALSCYSRNLSYARQFLPEKKAIALYSDLIAVYKATKQFTEAKRYCLLMRDEAERIADSARLSSAWLNLGVMYRSLKEKDSAIIAYNNALRIKERIGDSAGLATLRINLAAFYDSEKMFREEYETILPNIAYHAVRADSTNLFYDYSNAAAALIGLHRFGEALPLIDKARALVTGGSNRKMVDVLEIYAEYYRVKGDYKTAYDYKEQAIVLDRQLLDESTGKQMAEAMQKFETEKKEQQNRLLTVQLDKNRLQKRNLGIIAVSGILLALIIGLGWWQKQKINRQLQEKNEVINRQVDKLAELNSEKNNLIGIVSHDLSGPFVNIGVWSAVLQRKNDNLDERQKEALDHIARSAAQGQRLIRNILDVEKVETGKRRLQLENVDVSALFTELKEQYASLAEQKQLVFHCAIPPNLQWLTDRDMLHRIAENLLSNAIKYTQPGKQVWLQVSAGSERLQIVVKDEGVGIRKEELPKLFHRYTALSPVTTAGETSTGLGLSIVKRLVDELNGEILVESEAGKGSVFTVNLHR